MKDPLSSWLPTLSVCLSSPCSQFTVPLLEPFPWISTPQLVHSLPSIHTSYIANTYSQNCDPLLILGRFKTRVCWTLIFSHICQVPAWPSSFRLSPALDTSSERLLHWTEHPWGSLVPAFPQFLEWLRALDSSCLFRDSLDTLQLRARTLKKSLPDLRVWLLYYQTHLVESHFPHLSKWE